MANEFRIDVEASHVIVQKLEEVAGSILSGSEKVPTECRGGDAEHLLWGITGDVIAVCDVLHTNATRGAAAVRRIADDASYMESEFEAEFELLTRSLDS